MGAEQLTKKLAGQANKFRIKQWYMQQLEHDKEYNGHQDGYSGDLQTIHGGIVTHFENGIFKSLDLAYEYCQTNCKKWGAGIAVHYLTNNADGPVINTLIFYVVAC